MTIKADPGPEIRYGQNPPRIAGGPPDQYNQDYGPSLISMGSGLIDPRFGYAPGGLGNGSAQAFGFAPGVNYAVIDEVPATAATANIAPAHHPASGVALTLVSASGSGIIVTANPTFIKATGKSVPSGALAIDAVPGVVAFGQSQAIQIFDPTKAIARAVSVTGVSGGSGGTVTVRGYDLYGFSLTETITLAAGANTVNGKKAFKFIASATPAFTDANNISVGTADIYGLPLRADVYGYINATFNNAPITSTTFAAAVTTTATATSGDVRGTITATSDGTKRLQIMQGVSVANLASLTDVDFSGLFGVAQYSG